MVRRYSTYRAARSRLARLLGPPWRARQTSSRSARAPIADWVECHADQGHAGVLTLADDDPDGAVDARFDGAAANAQRGSKTVHVGLEWHALADVREDAWRRKHMHFPGQHRAAAAMRALGVGGAGSLPSSGSSPLPSSGPLPSSEPLPGRAASSCMRAEPAAHSTTHATSTTARS